MRGSFSGGRVLDPMRGGTRRLSREQVHAPAAHGLGMDNSHRRPLPRQGNVVDARAVFDPSFAQRDLDQWPDPDDDGPDGGGTAIPSPPGVWVDLEVHADAA